MNINVTLHRVPTEIDWRRCKQLALNTVGRKFVGEAPGTVWRQKILKSEHSPIRTLMFTIEMEIPYWVSVHFCRHKFGVEHYVQSQRNDRQDAYDRNAAPQGMMVAHFMDINAAELIQIARKRLCRCASTETRAVMEAIVRAVIAECPEFAEVLVRECEYRNGLCPEFASCGRPYGG